MLCLVPPVEFYAAFWLSNLPFTAARRLFVSVVLFALALVPLAAGVLAESLNDRMIGYHDGDDDRRTVRNMARVVTAVVVAAAPISSSSPAASFRSFRRSSAAARCSPPAWSSTTRRSTSSTRQVDVSASDLASPQIDLVWEEAERYLIRWQSPAGAATARLPKAPSAPSSSSSAGERRT